MAGQSDVKVFISWSGGLSKGVAVALREWLPLLFDRVAPWASDTDIAAGQRGLAQIEAELTDTRFGVVVVTAENQHAPWLNFEAGALSKTVVGDVEHRVVPLLVDLSGPTQLTGPLAQFQAKTATADGVRDLVRSLAAVAGIDEGVASARFDAYWPQLEAKVQAAKAAQPAARETKREGADVLDEILLHVRALRSETEAPAQRRPTGETERERMDRAFNQKVASIAALHNLELFDVARPPNGEREITVSPRGQYSADDVAAFERAYREQASEYDRRVKITAIPF